MGDLYSSEGAHLRFLEKCPELPPVPSEDQVQAGFDEFLLASCADPELREELNATESIETKWAYTFLSKLPHGVDEGWLDSRECVDLVQRYRSDINCVHDLLLAIRINIMLRPSAWVEKFVSERGIEELFAPLQAPGGASVETCNEVLSTLFVLTNNSCGLSAVLGFPDCCALLYSIFDLSPSNAIKARSLKMLGMLCRESTMAQDSVMSAFSSETPEERTLQSLVAKLEQNQSDVTLQHAAVKFVNTLLEATRDRKQRVAICEDLKASGLCSLLEPFRNRDDHTDEKFSALTTMKDQVKAFFEFCNEATNGDKLGSFRLALGNALNANRSSSEQSSHIGRPPNLVIGNQRENEEVNQVTMPEVDQLGKIDSRTMDTETVETEARNTMKTLGREVKEKKEPASCPESLPLDKIFNDLQSHTKNMDQVTSEKLASLLQKLALTLSDKSGASQVVDRLEKSLLSTHNPAPEAVMNVSNLVQHTQEPDLLTRVSLALFPSMGEQPASVTKPPTSGRPTLFSGFGDFSLSSLTSTTPAKNSVSRPSFTSFIGAEGAASPWGRSTDSMGGRGVKLSLPFFQSSRKGPGLGVTPACTPIATASVRKDAKRPVFPSFPSPPKKDVPAIISPPPPSSSLSASLEFAAASLPPIDIAPALPTIEVVKPLVIEQDESKNPKSVVTEIDISKFRKLLSMGAPREAVRAKMLQAGVNPDLLDEKQGFTPKASPKPAPLQNQLVPEVTKEEVTGADVSKLRKLLSMGAPLEAVKAKMRQAGLDPVLLDQKEEVNQPTPPPPSETSSRPDITKFKKLLSMGAPLAAVKAKMTQAGLDPALLDSPSPASLTASSALSTKTKVKDDPSYAKFFKLLSMGAPAPAVKAKMLQAGLNSELLDTPDADVPPSISASNSTPATPAVATNPRALLSNMLASHTAPQPDPTTKVKDDPQYAKFFKLLSMGAPAESVKAKMRMAGLQPELLDTPDATLKPAAGACDATSSQTQTKVKDDPAYAKFFKLLSMGAPTESVKAKMRMAGLQADLLDTPDAVMPNIDAPVAATQAAVKVKDDPAYAKFFKLLSMGAPTESVKVKMQMAGLKPELLDTPEADLPNESTQAPAPPAVKVKDDPAYSKFFKLLEMGAPAESVKAKMRMAGLQADLLDTPGAILPSSAPANLPAAPAPNSTAARRAHLSIAIKPAVKSKTRAFYWQQLKAEAIKGTIWEELEKEHSNQSNQDLLTLTEKELALLETEFPPPAACGPSTGTRRGSITGIGSPGGPTSPLASPRIVFLIDRARSNNISIIVKQFRMSNAALRVAIMKMDSEVLTLDRVQGLIKILPTEEEIAAITGFHGDPTTLNGAELVLKELITVPRLKQRLSALETKHQFPALVRDLQTKINKIRVASNEIAQSAELKTLLLVILQVGNKMNDGTARGGAKGFRLNDLTKLVQLKSVDKSVTLLHYVARMVRLKKGNVVRLGDSLASLYDVQSIPIPELQGDMSRINDITENINVELAAQRLKNRIEEKEEIDLFVESMTVFVDEAGKEVSALKNDLDEALRLMRDIMLRFDKNTDDEEALPPSADAPLTSAALTGAGEFFSIIYEFTMSLMKADRENEIKRIRDEKRLKQQELKNATPRRNSIDRARLSKMNVAGPEVQETPRRKSMLAVPSSASLQTEGVSPLLPGMPNNPTTTIPDTKPEAESTTSTGSPSKVVSPRLSELKKTTSPDASEIPHDGKGPEEKKVSALSGIPKTALKLPGKIVKDLSIRGTASPLKKIVGTIPTGIPSPLRLKRTNSSTSSTEKTDAAVLFDVASIKEIKSSLETKHATDNNPQVLQTLKPEVEAEGDDHDNNNSEPSSPEKALSEAEPSTRVAI